MNEQLIITLYNEGESNKIISENFSIHRSTVQRILKRNGVKLREKEVDSRKHNFENPKIFESLNSELEAYSYGLICADGNLSRNCIEITLAEPDVELLQNLSKQVYGKVTLGYREARGNNKAQYRFRITSKKIAERLRKFGLTENKSLILNFPELENEEQARNFIRGYFDGDGSLHISKHKNNNRVSIVGSKSFCKRLALEIDKWLGLNLKSSPKTSNVDFIGIYGNLRVKKFLDWMYKDSTIFMERKYKKYKENYEKI